MCEFRESIPLGPLLRKSSTAVCAALGVFLLAVCGFVAIVDGDPTGYVIGTLSVAICFGTAVYLWRVRVTIDTDSGGRFSLRPVSECCSESGTDVKLLWRRTTATN